MSTVIYLCFDGFWRCPQLFLSVLRVFWRCPWLFLGGLRGFGGVHGYFLVF